MTPAGEPNALEKRCSLVSTVRNTVISQRPADHNKNKPVFKITKIPCPDGLGRAVLISEFLNPFKTIRNLYLPYKLKSNPIAPFQDKMSDMPGPTSDFFEP